MRGQRIFWNELKIPTGTSLHRLFISCMRHNLAMYRSSTIRGFVPLFVSTLLLIAAAACNAGGAEDEPTAVDPISSVPGQAITGLETKTPIVAATREGIDPSDTVSSVNPTTSTNMNPTVTAVAMGTSLATPRPWESPTALPVPVPTSILSGTPTPTALPRPTPTSVPTPTPSSLPTPTPIDGVNPTPTTIIATNPTPTPRPTSTATSIPTPTLTPVPIPDDRYGVVVSGPGLEWQLNTLGIKWFIDYLSDPRDAPVGTNRVPYIGVKPGTTRLSPESVADYAAGAPGSYWYIGGETNVPAQNGISAAAYVVEFDYYVPLILAADPSAKILGPSVLNWDFSCTGCSWNNPGRNWIPDFVNAYAAAHNGESPPIDAWALDAYPLTWDPTPEFPNPLPMTEWEVVVNQAIGYREYLQSSVPGHANTPIWITEMASHWAYDTVSFVDSEQAIPEGLPYRWDAMNEYVAKLSGWLNANGDMYGIDRWFLYRGYIDIADHAKNGYAGIYLFESGDTGAALTPTGEVYRDFAKGIRQ